MSLKNLHSWKIVSVRYKVYRNMKKIIENNKVDEINYTDSLEDIID